MDGGMWDGTQGQYRLAVLLTKIIESFLKHSDAYLTDFLSTNNSTISV
jgi:hypothetical protein